MHEPSDTRERILQAALSLISKKGVKGATTLAIAKEAGVNEVTIFRHFKNKEGLLQAAVQRVSYVQSFKELLRQNVTGVLEDDLYLFAETYQRLLQENADLIIIGLRESELSETLAAEIVNIPIQMKQALVEYFEHMARDGKLIDTDMEAQALAFIWMNFGYFQSAAKFGNKITELTTDQFIKASVKTFARGLIPTH